MRIDSVKDNGNNKIYYPFKTARISIAFNAGDADTLGNSWWGSMILEDTLTGVNYHATQISIGYNVLLQIPET